MPRHIKIGLIVMGIGLVVASGFFIDVVGRVRSMMQNDRAAAEFKPPVQPLYAPTDPPFSVKLFFPTIAGGPLLKAEDQVIFKSDALPNRARQILAKLQAGPRDLELVASMPADVKVEDLFISEQGTAYIDFSNTISSNHTGGVVNELATIYSIVDSLIYNLPEIKQVKILIGGAEKETLAGHCLLLLPLTMDLSLTDVMPREESSALIQ